MRSRLKSNIKKHNLHLILGIIAIIVILSLFGTRFLIGFGILLDKVKGGEEQQANTQMITYVAPPILNPAAPATNKDSVDLSGNAESGEVNVQLFVNGKLVGREQTTQDGSFNFRDVPLDKGENEIKARVITGDNRQSEYSDQINIKYLDKEPTIEISSPTDGQVFKKDENPIRITGKTESGVKVTVNGFWTISKDDGTFYYIYTLKDGDNTLKFDATDEAENRATKEIKIKVE